MEKKQIFLLCHYEIILSILKISSAPNPLQRPYSGDCDPENVNRKPPVILKIVPEAGYLYVHLRKLTNSGEAKIERTNGREQKL